MRRDSREWGLGVIAAGALGAPLVAAACHTGECAGSECVTTSATDPTTIDGGGAGVREAGDSSAVFGGITSLSPASPTSLQVTWAPGFDTGTPVDELRYAIYLADASEPLAYDHPIAVTAAGARVHVQGGLVANNRYVAAVRVLTADDRSDQNRVQVFAATAADVAPPRFDGVGHVLDLGGGSLRVSWRPAEDELTAAAGISYLVYVTGAPGGENFANATFTTSRGALTATVPGNATSVAVVRARDASGNVDTNVTEFSAQTGVSFSFDVQPIFTTNCGVPGCHVPGNPESKMVLVEGFAYANTVDVPSAEDSRFVRVAPGSTDNSYLFQKISGTALRGTKMPAPGTGSVLLDSDKELLRQWIIQGAVDH